MFAAVAGAGAALGLLLGGLLTEYLTWRWVLFVNVPIGIALVAGAYVFVHESDRLSGRFDWLGGALSTIGMASLVYGFIHAASKGWSNPTTIGAFVVAAVLLLGFVALEARLSYAMMPLRTFRDKNRSGAYIVMLIIGAAMFGMFFFVTYFVQLVLGYSSLKAGLAFLPVAFTIGIAAQLSARLMPRIGPRNLILFGSVVMAGGLFWLSTISADSSYAGHLLPSLLVMSFGIGCIFVPLTTVVGRRRRAARGRAGLGTAQRRPAGRRLHRAVGADHGVRHRLPQRGQAPGPGARRRWCRAARPSPPCCSTSVSWPSRPRAPCAPRPARCRTAPPSGPSTRCWRTARPGAS